METAIIQVCTVSKLIIVNVGEAPSQRISELEELFEINRDDTKIKQLRKGIG